MVEIVKRQELVGPPQAHQAQGLAAAEGKRFFAGEACSRSDAATVHGAWASGERAANAVLRG